MTTMLVLLGYVTTTAMVIVYFGSVHPRWDRFCKRKGEEAVERIRRRYES